MFQVAQSPLRRARRACRAISTILAFAIGVAAGHVQAAEIYKTQGYVDYTIGGIGTRAYNSSASANCNSVSDQNYWVGAPATNGNGRNNQTATFSLAIPAGASIDRAFVFWGGSGYRPGGYPSTNTSVAGDSTATLTINGVSQAVTADVSLAQRTANGDPELTYYESRADVTTFVRANAGASGTINVAVSSFETDAQFPSFFDNDWASICGVAGGATLAVVYTTDFSNPSVSPKAVVIDDVITVLRGGGEGSYASSVIGLASAATVPNARFALVTMEGDANITSPLETFTLNGVDFSALVGWNDGDKNLDATMNGNSWELDALNALQLGTTIAAGSTSATYQISTGDDIIMPVVMGLSWDVRSDYGDAPASYGIARHNPADISDNGGRLGAGVDFEGASQFSSDANGDDANGDDEGGVASLPVLTTASTSYSATTTCYGGVVDGLPQVGYVNAWIDFNRNGVFDNPSERAQATCPAGAAANVTLNWTVLPAQIVAGPTFMRLRIGRVANQVDTPTGNSVSGEVEDYKLDIAPVIAVNKMVWPEADSGVFNFSANGTSIGVDIGDDAGTGIRTLYNKVLNNYNGMAGTAPNLAVAADITTSAVPVSIVESSGTGTALSDYSTTISCINAAGTTVFTGDPATTASFNLPVSNILVPNGQAQRVTCNYTNYTTRFLVVKNTQGGNGSFNFTASGNKAASFTITTAAGTGSQAIALERVTPTAPGSTETVAETVPAGWRLDSIACTYLAPDGSTGNAGVVSSPSVQIALTRGYSYTCTFTNAVLTADLSITKTNTPASGPSDLVGDSVASGASTTYQIIVSNAGPDAADMSVVRDTPSGMTCSSATCAATAGATCPAQTGASLADALQAGVAIPQFPAGSSLTFNLNCSIL